MLLSISGFESSKTVQVRIYNVTAAIEVVAWTATGVNERADGYGYSTYYYDYAIVSGNEYIVDWKDNSTPVNTASEGINAKETGGGVNVIAAVNGSLQVDTIKDGGVITIYRKTKVAITFNLAKSMTGRKLFFAVRKEVQDLIYTIPVGGTTPKEITATTDLATGSGYVDLSTAETDIGAALYSYGEIQSISDAGGDPIPEQIFQLRVKDHALNL